MVDMTLKPGEGKQRKLIRDALLAVERNDPARLKRLAEKWWDRAEDDQMAVNALADRLDGKPVQMIAGDPEGEPVQLSGKIEIVHVKP